MAKIVRNDMEKTDEMFEEGTAKAKVEEPETTEDVLAVPDEEMQLVKREGVVDFSAKKETKTGENSWNYTHEFKKPIMIDGKSFKTLTFYFDDLTGQDVEAAEAELQAQNIYVLTPETSSHFHAVLAARAARIPVDDIRRLPVHDYMKIKNQARNFLISLG